jgi:hypothetical protein
MPFIVSDWKITFDHGGASAFELCAQGDEIDEEIAFPWSQSVDTSKPMGGAAVVKFGRAQVETSFTVAVWKSHATQKDARNYLLALTASLPLGMAKNLRIDVKAGNAYLLSTAVIAGGDMRMVPAVGVVRTWVQYKIEGGKFSVVT